ncbi:MAG: Ig-like domain-containing protein [Candidatus Eisenbacteria bacterium]|nr:Ig-like domain-containing protein [Candidatus Eisenbacteria bacterium]
MRKLATPLLALLLTLVTSPVLAAIPQTIVVDGVNDFDPSNLLGDDTNDTQPGCAPVALPMDLGKIFVTNDANFLYIGIEFSRSCYCDMNLGIALDVGTAGGGTTDPFGRKIGWTNVPFKPDFVIYDVTPTSCNSFNYEVLYKDTLATWQNRSTSINPAWGSGANGLGIVDSVTFKELKIPLSVLGVGSGTNMNLEFWVTQEGSTKGPLDAFCSDDVQMSRGSQTTYDTTAVVQMTCMTPYTVQNAVDNAPPTVQSAQAVNFTVLANRQFSLLTNKIDVQFNEPVELASAQTPGNYAIGGPLSRTVVSAVRDGASSSLVHLTLNSAINANATAYTVTVTGVDDAASNTIVANGTTNVAGFFLQNVTFNADLALPLCAGTFAASDTFAVEGSVAPLSFALCDNGLMYDANLDSVYTVTVPFCLARDPGTSKGSASLEWKLTAKCNTYESFPGNRVYDLSSDNGAGVTLNVAWSNEDPASYTAHPVDVVFRVDASLFNPTGSDVITLVGGALPLTFNQPGVPMLDGGVAPDATAGDKIYTARVSFPACTPKNFGWKVDFNGVYECAGQGDRGVYLDDALYSASTPLILPARGIDRCDVTDKPVTVLFRVNMDPFDPVPADPETLAVMGDRAPLSFDHREAASVLRNDGVFPDAAAGDAFFGRAITFPDSTPFRVEYKYWLDGTFECEAMGNRVLTLDDVNYSTGNPQVNLGTKWNYCTDATDVPVTPVGRAGELFASLRPVMPNPVVRGARFSFELFRAGRVALRIYDVSGRRVASVVDRDLAPGQHTIAWDGRGDDGVRLRSGVYLYELSLDGQRAARRMVLAR